MVAALKEKDIKLWQLLSACAVQLVCFGIWVGIQLNAQKALAEQVNNLAVDVTSVNRDVIRIDTEGTRRWSLVT